MADSCDIIIIDLRFPNTLYETLINHELNVNSISLAPNMSHCIASVGEDGRVLIWNILTENSENVLNPLIEPSFIYEIGEPISNIFWNVPNEKSIIITFGNKFQVLKL